MARCTCKTLKGTQCKNDAVSGSKTCSLHKKCKSKVSVRKGKSKVAKKAKSKVIKKKTSLNWITSEAWESPIPLWMKGGEKVKTKPLSPKKKTPEPWWLQ